MSEPTPGTAARWVAIKNGEVVAEAATSKDLFLRLREPDLADVRGIITERRKADA